MTSQLLEVTQEQEGFRIDKAVSALLPELSRSAVQNLCAAGQVLLNGAPASKSAQVRAGDQVTVEVPDPEPLEVEAEDTVSYTHLKDGYLSGGEHRRGSVQGGRSARRVGETAGADGPFAGGAGPGADVHPSGVRKRGRNPAIF